MGGVVAISELATLGLFSNWPSLWNPADMCLGVWIGNGRRHSRMELELSVSQSLMASTIISLSLRIRSAPLEFLTGPMGAEMRGRLFFPRPRILFRLQQSFLKGRVLIVFKWVLLNKEMKPRYKARGSLAFSGSQRREKKDIKIPTSWLSLSSSIF